MDSPTYGKIQQTSDRHAPEVSKQTGFPSAATHYMEMPIDLHKELAIHKDATFYIRVDGDQWKQHRIFHNDVLIVDRSLQSRFGDLGLVVQDGEFKAMRIGFGEEEEYVLWGIITYIIHYAR